MRLIFVGIDWAEAHHDVCVLDEAGGVLAKGRLPDGIEGVARLHEMLAAHAEEPAEVAVGIEIDRGLLVGALAAAGYRIYAVNPFAASRYRDRHATSGAKSDPGDAKVLADLVRTDRQNHREVAGDSELAEAVKVLARGHQSLIWSRTRQANALRNHLREYYPGALAAFPDLGSLETCAVLSAAPTPELGKGLSEARIIRLLRAGGRSRNLERRASDIRDALQAPQLEAGPVISKAYGEVVRSLVEVIEGLSRQIERLQGELSGRFEMHPGRRDHPQSSRTRISPRRPGARRVRG
jgi:transposase